MSLWHNPSKRQKTDEKVDFCQGNGSEGHFRREVDGRRREQDQKRSFKAVFLHCGREDMVSLVRLKVNGIDQRTERSEKKRSERIKKVCIFGSRQYCRTGTLLETEEGL